MDTIADEGLRDFPLTWSHIRRGLYCSVKRKGYFPELVELTHRGAKVERCEYSVVIKVTPDMIDELREWLEENAQSKYKLFGRFGWTRNHFTVARECEGVKFTFTDIVVAVHFKLYWYDGKQ